MNFPSCNASKCRILRCFATHAAIYLMHRILSNFSFQRKMRQISASKRNQNVVEIAKTDYCCFGRVSHAAIYLMHRILSNFSFQRKMRQISASKRNQNVVEIAKTDYCCFGRVSTFILSHPSISRQPKQAKALMKRFIRALAHIIVFLI